MRKRARRLDFQGLLWQGRVSQRDQQQTIAQPQGVFVLGVVGLETSRSKDASSE